MGLGAMLLALLLTFTWAYWYLGSQPKTTAARRLLVWSTLLGTGTCLVTFTGLSVASGIIQFGQAATYRLPQDYLAAGAAGWLALMVGLAGILIPLFVTLFIRQTYHH